MNIKKNGGKDMKKWENPSIETLDVASTMWTNFDGDVPDEMFHDCDPLYYS